MKTRMGTWWWLAACTSAVVLAACGGGSDSGGSMSSGMSYAATNLVSDVNTSSNPYATSNVDTHLVNPWGIAFNPAGFVWVANNGTSTATLYDGNGVAQSLVVTIPAGSSGNAAPTGIVFNATTGFMITQGGTSGASAFIFATEGGTIAGWSPNVNLNSAVTVIDAAAAGKVYKGLAITATRLYAADFHNGVVDVYDGSFAPVVRAGAFVDPQLPAGYAPFNVTNIGGKLYVSYAKQDSAKTDEIAGAGKGFVDVYNASGDLLRRLISRGALNAPWGMTIAPDGFGRLGGALLVGNFGDGRINAYDPASGAWMATLRKRNGHAVQIDGLWALMFGNGTTAKTSPLLFSAGPDEESHGLFGAITAAP